MDLTPVFKASIMAVKMRNKSLPVPNKNRILQTKAKDEYSRQAKDICQKITSLRILLLENRSAYMKFAAHLKSSVQMTDEERDLIDRESEKIVNFYTQHLGQLRSEWRQVKKTKTKQHGEHIDGVLELLSNYLKSVHNIHMKQKKYRMQYELETYKFLKLASDKKKIPVRPGKNLIKMQNNDDNCDDNDENKSMDINSYSSSSELHERNRKSSNDEDFDDDEELDDFHNNKIKIKNQDYKISSQQKVALDEAMNESYDEVFTPEDIQMYESENVQLYHELQGLSEEVEQIEKNVVDIARLQDIFTEKIVLQKHDIERIANAVVGATENVKDANDQIKQAIQRNAGLRVWTLFFLLVMSFTLLFLDWYND